ncbi:MAG: hypothetical protein LBR31_00560 [Desulfovibrio sp.]|jgi:hypothetical protein|nr:hypothetical protein [Desulfovibrio sp.]
MKKLRMLLPALLLCAVTLLQTEDAWASRVITLQNASSKKITVALVLPSDRGWWVTAWYTVAPWSTRKIYKSWAGGNAFGYYAHVVGRKDIAWRGRGDSPTIYLTSSAQNHSAKQRSGSPHKVIMKRGSSVKFTWSGDQAGIRRATGAGGGAWW